MRLEDFAKVFKALGEPSRLRIFRALSGGEKCVCELEALLEMSQPRISQHLKVLREAGLVKERRDGWWVYYRINDELLSTAFPDFLSRFKQGLQAWPDAAQEVERLAGLANNPTVAACRLPRGERSAR